MPILDAMYAVLYKQIPVSLAIEEMSNKFK